MRSGLPHFNYLNISFFTFIWYQRRFRVFSWRHWFLCRHPISDNHMHGWAAVNPATAGPSAGTLAGDLQPDINQQPAASWSTSQRPVTIWCPRRWPAVGGSQQASSASSARWRSVALTGWPATSWKSVALARWPAARSFSNLLEHQPDGISHGLSQIILILGWKIFDLGAAPLDPCQLTTQLDPQLLLQGTRVARRANNEWVHLATHLQQHISSTEDICISPCSCCSSSARPTRGLQPLILPAATINSTTDASQMPFWFWYATTLFHPYLATMANDEVMSTLLSVPPLPVDTPHSVVQLVIALTLAVELVIAPTLAVQPVFPPLPVAQQFTLTAPSTTNEFIHHLQNPCSMFYGTMLLGLPAFHVLCRYMVISPFLNMSHLCSEIWDIRRGL